MSIERLLLVVANIVGFVLMLAFWLSPAKLASHADAVYVYCLIVFVIDAICVAPPVWVHRGE